MSKSKLKSGWSVAIFRKNGTHFMCAAGIGDSPPIWAKPNRKWAVKHKQELVAEGFNAKVVPVTYRISPKIIVSSTKRRARPVKLDKQPPVPPSNGRPDVDD